MAADQSVARDEHRAVGDEESAVPVGVAVSNDRLWSPGKVEGTGGGKGLCGGDSGAAEYAERCDHRQPSPRAWLPGDRSDVEWARLLQEVAVCVRHFVGVDEYREVEAVHQFRQPADVVDVSVGEQCGLMSVGCAPIDSIEATTSSALPGYPPSISVIPESSRSRTQFTPGVCTRYAVDDAASTVVISKELTCAPQERTVRRR